MADSAAQLANFQRSDAFWKLHSRFMRQTDEEEQRFLLIQQTLLGISQAILFKQVVNEPVDLPPDQGPEQKPAAPISPNPWPGLPQVAGVPRALADRFGHRVVTSISNWFFHTFEEQTAPNARWIQLYIDFMQSTGDGGPIHLGEWEDSANRPQASLPNIAFKTRCRWWTHVLKSLMNAWRMPFNTLFTRPDSRMLILHTSCLWTPIDDQRLEAVDLWLQSHLGHPAKRNGTELNRLPSAKSRASLLTVPRTIAIW
jgi:hypothetical protein